MIQRFKVKITYFVYAYFLFLILKNKHFKIHLSIIHLIFSLLEKLKWYLYVYFYYLEKK